MSEEARNALIVQMEKARENELVLQLLAKIDDYVAGRTALFEEKLKADVEDKLESPGGASLLMPLGYIYEQEGIYPFIYLSYLSILLFVYPFETILIIISASISID